MKPSSSLCIKGSEYMTVHSAPPKRPSGRTKFRETRHPIYRGVRRRGTSNRWVCEVRNPNNKSRIWLGTFATADMAARAHDVAAMALCGRSACLNFADSAWLIKLPDSFSNVNDIKKAAIEAAENFKCKDILSSPSSASSSSSHQSSVEVIEEIISMAIEKTVDLEIISMAIAKTVNLEIISVAIEKTVNLEIVTMAIEKTVNLEMDYDIELNMDLGSYYTNLAEGIVTPANWFDDLDDNNWGSPMSLWN